MGDPVDFCIMAFQQCVSWHLCGIALGYVGGKRKQIEKGGFKTERAATKAMQDVLYHLNNTGDYLLDLKLHFRLLYRDSGQI